MHRDLIHYSLTVEVFFPQVHPPDREAQMDFTDAGELRLLREEAKPRGISTTRRGTLLKHQVPVRTYADWADTEPGFVEADLVAQCGQLQVE